MKCVKCKKNEQGDYDFTAVTKGLCKRCWVSQQAKAANKKIQGLMADSIAPHVPKGLLECPSCHGVGVHKIGCAGAGSFVDYSQLKTTESDGSWWKQPPTADISDIEKMLAAAPFPTTFPAEFIGAAAMIPRFADGTTHTFKVDRRIGRLFMARLLHAASPIVNGVAGGDDGS